jgi:hypothetical protein
VIDQARQEISEPLTWAEICARYPDEWVCLVEMDFIYPNGHRLSGRRVARGAADCSASAQATRCRVAGDRPRAVAAQVRDTRFARARHRAC